MIATWLKNDLQDIYEQHAVAVLLMSPAMLSSRSLKVLECEYTIHYFFN